MSGPNRHQRAGLAVRVRRARKALHRLTQSFTTTPELRGAEVRHLKDEGVVWVHVPPTPIRDGADLHMPPEATTRELVKHLKMAVLMLRTAA